ncbi:zinc-dependent metalloprotease [Aquincola sp. J276]|uniref:zinc-dependent metalloprotease n=1 Tax=Aquincola sp. J276 TaxID=2898432 RepID=UPI0021519380|nr:zinc-dependent metalloprotease [Aquincola sp. J276]MCR5866886.1 zinc-dependent metalloprotease [Aquincola sp. J276]
MLILSGCAALQRPAAGPAAASGSPAPARPPAAVGGGAATMAAAAGAAAAPAAGASAPAGGSAAGAPPPGAAARPDPAAPRPFADVIREAKVDDGFFPVWRKDEKVWLEIPSDRFGKPFLLTAGVSQSVGERGLYGGQMANGWMVELRRIGNTVQLVAKNTDFVASGDPALARTVRQSFSDSLLGAAPVASAEHPQRKSVLVDAAFLLSDIVGYSTLLEAAYRLPYGLDRGNSWFESARADGNSTSLNANLHFVTPRIPAPPLVRPPTPTPMPSPPTTTPDPRSLFVGIVYSLQQLPQQPMAPRAADPRLGHFTDAFTDYGQELKPNLRVHHVARWRLEKKEPDAALSEPVQPITYWLDRNIPQRYRASVEAGVLEWNKAFERIGFKNAVVVKQQPDDATFDTLDASHASIRWFVGSDVGFARGPSVRDPRTGEILDADIAMSDVFARGARRFATEDLGTSPAKLQSFAQPFGRHQHNAFCDYAEQSSDEAAFAFDLLAARAELPPDSPEVEAIVQAYVKDVIMHEVGHTLGLKHNFKASTTVNRNQLQDRSFTEANGIVSSVMDYTPFNIALANERQGNYVTPTLGAYDYWAIEYAYKPIPREQEAQELGRIAARSTEPQLAYADDADADSGRGGGIDPYTNRFDLGDDPLAWYRKRFALSRELWDRVQARGARPGDDPQRERRVLASGFRQLRDIPQLTAKYVGGMVVQRDLPGTTGRPTYKPVEPARQREALRFLADSVFSVDSFRFRPEFLASLSPDFNEWERGQPVSIPTLVLGLQTQALDRLMTAGTAQRVLDLPAYLTARERNGALTLNEVYGTLQSSIWRELKQGGEIDGMRRNLQREHLKRVQALLTRPSDLPADAMSLVRMQATELQAQLKASAGRSGVSAETRAHLQESLSTLNEALRATMVRS